MHDSLLSQNGFKYIHSIGCPFTCLYRQESLLSTNLNIVVFLLSFSSFLSFCCVFVPYHFFRARSRHMNELCCHSLPYSVRFQFSTLLNILVHFMYEYVMWVSFLSFFLSRFVCLVLSLVWCFFILLISFIEIHLLNFTVLAHTKEIKKRSSFVCVFFVFAWILVLFILFYFFGWCKRFFRYHLGNQHSSSIQFSN